jgi:arylsulfatase A-like enzyme
MMFFYRTALLLAALAVSAIPARAQSESLASIFTNHPAARPQTFPRRASIIFIALDGLGFGDLSCYGQTNFLTPNFDKLAAEGTRFTNYSAGGDDLATAQAVLMGGNLSLAQATGQITVAARLQQAGYHTGLIGEWLLGPQPWSQGFNEFAGYFNDQDANNYYADFMWRYLPGTVYDPTNHSLPVFSTREAIYDNSGGRHSKYIPDVLMTAAVNFVRIQAPGRGNHYRPFFLMVNIPAPRTIERGKDEYPVPTDAPFTDERWPQPAKNRAALLTRLDEDLGRLMEQLKSSSMTNNVMIFLAGATAPEKFANPDMNFLKLNGEVRGGDSPERLRTPMIVYWPGHVPAGRVSSARWSAVDFAPTAMETAYARPAASFAGISMLPLLLDKHPTNINDMPLDVPQEPLPSRP